MGRGEDREFDDLVAAEGDGLFRFLYWMLGHREEALDAVQEVLVRAHRGLPKLREKGSRKHWLYRIATNVGRDARTKRRRGMPTFGLVAHEDAQSPRSGGREPTPVAKLEASETNEALARGLASLEPELREPLLLFAVSGLKYREIAEALGWPIGTVTTRIHNARQKLAQQLGDRGKPSAKN